MASVNLQTWWFAIPLLAAETYSCIDTSLFALTVWKLRERGYPPKAPDGHTVDVLITRYNEPVELLRATVRAARAIDYPHRTFVVDDGDSPEVRAMASAEGVDYITRGDEWKGRPRHAKAGNLSNALMRTEGEFVLVLDADQVSRREILDRTLGYFRDPMVALVQTQQFFHNVPEGDPFGSQAPLFYGPIQQGKDGWDAAFFCGSNAVLRRDALMQAGVARYVKGVTDSVRRVLGAAEHLLSRTARRAADDGDERTAAALRDLQQAAAEARHAHRRGDPIQRLTYRFQQRVQEVSRRLVAEDLSQIRADIAAIQQTEPDLEAGGIATSPAGGRAVTVLAGRDWSPLNAVEAVAERLGSGAPVEVNGTYAEQAHGHDEGGDFNASVYAVEVEVDRETGAVRVCDAVQVVDVGTVINPLAHQGQLNGGFAFGLGAALMEELPIDEGGKVAALSLGEYKLPTVMDMPPLRTVLLRTEIGPGPFGAKAVGEVTNSGVAPAIANAVADAVGARVMDLPITSEKVLSALG